MSKALDIAEAIRTRLVTAPAAGELETPCDLTAIPECILVDRQKSVSSLVAAAVAKAGGTAVMILHDDFRVADGNAKRPALELGYSVRVYSKPVLADGDYPADDVVEAIIKRLWQWVPGGGHQHREARVQPGGMIPDRSYLIYEIGVMVPASI